MDPLYSYSVGITAWFPWSSIYYLLGHICLYTYIYAQSQSKYISVFSLILFLYDFHFTAHTLFQFFLKFPYFCCCSIHLKKPVISTWHSYFLLFRHLHSHTLCGIKLYNMHCAHSLTVTPKTLSILTLNLVWEVHCLTGWEFCLALVEWYIVHTLGYRISPWVMWFGP